jgi:hypothetical protein
VRQLSGSVSWSRTEPVELGLERGDHLRFLAFAKLTGPDRRQDRLAAETLLILVLEHLSGMSRPFDRRFNNHLLGTTTGDSLRCRLQDT